MYYDIELERLIAEGIKDHQPTDGRWDRPLEGNDSNVYRFNIASDPCGSQSRPCYQVNLNNHNGEVSISFSRDGSHSDQYRGVGLEVFKSVLKALIEYITVKKPNKLSWSAIRKSVANPSSGKITNPEARAHVYEAWALRHLFPEKYVGMDGQWLRRDIYDKEWVPNGFPPIPDNINDNSPSGEKRRVLEDLQEKARKNRTEIQSREHERREAENRRQREEQERREAERRRQEEEAERRRQEVIRQALEDPEKNPNGIKEGDVVYLFGITLSDEWGMENRLGRVHGFQFGSYRYGSSDESDPVHAVVTFTDEEEDIGDDFNGRTGYIALDRLKKESPEGRADRERRKQERIQAALASQEKNPNGIQQGDEIISWMGDDSVGSKQNGFRGKVREIEVDRWNNVTAKVDWTPEAAEALSSSSGRNVNNLSVGVGNLKKATPEIVEEIRRKMREHDIEQRVTSGRERWQSRTRHAGEEEEERPQDLATDTTPENDLTNHPGNPLHLKVGDLVKLRNPPRYGRQSRRRHFNGTLVRLEKSYNNSYVTGYIKFHGSNTRPYRVWNIANEIDRDDSEATSLLMAQQQVRQQRAQRAIASTGGHNIGDTVTVVNGRHRGKSGRIVNFRASGANMNAVIAPMDGEDFSVNVNMLQPPASTQPPAAESFSFRDYLMYFESRINRG